MEKEEEFHHLFFTLISQTCFDKAKEHVDKERELLKNAPCGPKTLLLAQMYQFALAEKSYIEFGFMQNKNKGFLRKDNSLRAVYEALRLEFKRVEEMDKMNYDSVVVSICSNICQFILARVEMIDFYERAYSLGTNIHTKHSELLQQIQDIIKRYSIMFSHIAFVPIKNIFSLECEILSNLLSSFHELQQLKFLPSLVLINGAHTKLSVWEAKIQTKESWKLGFLKNNTFPCLLQWLAKLKSELLSKFSFYYHNILANQTTLNEIRQQCSKLQIDYYQRMVAFQRKYDINCVFLLNIKSVAGPEPESSVIVSSFLKTGIYFEMVQKIIAERYAELSVVDRPLFYYDLHNHLTFIINIVEATIYLALVVDNKKSEKDAFLKTFLNEFCTNLRGSKIFASMKGFNK